jgi:ubiquitin-protein ligase
LASYRFVDQGQRRAVNARVDDPYMKVKDLVPNLITPLKLSKIDNRGIEMVYLLAFNGRFLNEEETLATAGIPDNATIDVIGLAADLGSGFQRHPREWQDYEELVQLQKDNPNVFDLTVLSTAFDGYPIAYRLRFKGIAGPVVDTSQIQRMSAPVLKNAKGEPNLAEHFEVDIHILERYPFIEPGFFYVDPVLYHPNVNPYSKKACLYMDWRPVNTLADCVERFILQISYTAFLPLSAGSPDILNANAYEWSKQYRQDHPDRLPFKNKAGEGPPALRKPAAPDSGGLGVEFFDEDDDEEIVIKSSKSK